MDPSELGSGRYEIQSFIGQGVSARVYRALDRQTGSPVAIKVLNPHLRTDAVSLERFRREIQVTRHLGHPQIVAIYDLVTEGDCTFLVMEYLEGRTLEEHVALEHPVDVEQAVSILEQILDVLSLCHAQDVIHRDLKPQNVMIDAKARVKLLDFGIARMTALRDLTQTGTSLGSPEYMAPELFATSSYDPRSDLYALGVMAFELVAGRLPFQGDSLATLYQQHLEAEVPDLAALRGDAPTWLCELIAKLLAKRTHERYQSADEALLDLRQRRVLARSWPELPRLFCLHCGERTPQEIPLCTHCGQEQCPSLEAGQGDLYCQESEDTEKLRSFFSEYLNLEPPTGVRRRQPLLARITAETIRLV
ncbi:MAG: serine/threonine-protein kinase, partial [Myxococcota bacterium]